MTLTGLMRDNELWLVNDFVIGTGVCLVTLGSCEIVEPDGSLTAFVGQGQTITEAVADMLTKIRGKRLFMPIRHKKLWFGYHEFDVPEDLTDEDPIV